MTAAISHRRAGRCSDLLLICVLVLFSFHFLSKNHFFSNFENETYRAAAIRRNFAYFMFREFEMEQFKSP